MGVRHRSDAPIERFDEFLHRVATLARRHRYHCNTSENVLDAMVEFGDQPLSVLLVPLAPGDITDQALETCIMPFGVEFGLGGFLKPHFSAIRTYEAVRNRV